LVAPDVLDLAIGEELLKQPRMAGHSLEGLNITTGWQALGLRVRPDGRCFQHPMDPGRFLEYRRQVDMDYMAYPDSVVTRADTDHDTVVAKRRDAEAAEREEKGGPATGRASCVQGRRF
jgi:hypothetical protein